MANQFLNAQVYANVMLLMVKNQMVMGRLVDGQFKNEVTDENGLTVNVKRPPRFLDKKDGTAALATQDIVTGTVPVTVDQYSKVHISVGDIEYIQSYNALMQNATMLSAASRLAQSIDGYLTARAFDFPSWVAGGQQGGVGGTNAVTGTANVQASAAAMSAHTRLMNMGVPNDGNLSGILTFDDAELIRGNMLTNYTPSINVPMLERVRIPMISEVDWYATQNVKTQTAGTRVQGDGATTGAQVAAASQNVNYRDVKGTAGNGQMTSTLSLKGLAAGATVAAGEVLTIAGCNAWDWRALQSLPYLQQFTTVGAATADGTGAVTVTVYPAIIVQGTSDGTSTDANTVFGTVDAAPALNAYVKFVGAASAIMRPRMVFHKRAIALVSARLHAPFTGVASFATDPETGVSIRYWRGSDISTGAHIHRWDMMYGAKTVDPLLGTRLTGYGG